MSPQIESSELMENILSSTGKERCFLKSEVINENGSVALLFLHDLGDYHRRYEEAATLLKRELSELHSIHYFDLKGHGFSSGMRGYINSFSEYVSDLQSCLEYVESKFQYQKLFVIAQGMGGLVALNLAHKLRKISIDGAILSNPLVHFQFEPPSWVFSSLKDYVSHILKLKMPFSLDGFSMTRDREKASEYNKDPLIVRRVSLGLAKEIIISGQNLRKTSYFIDLPCLFLISGQGHLVDPVKARLFFKGMPKGKSRIKVYDESFHDLFNDLNRNSVYHDIKDWINEF